MKIINLTQHLPTPAQTAEGVFLASAELMTLLNFDDIPDIEDIEWRAAALADIAVSEGAEAAMIGGAPYLMSALERALKARGVKPVYAFSLRDSEDVLDEETCVVKKTLVFKHLGFLEV